MNPVVNVSDEITLVSLHDIPANMQQIADIFEKIASIGIDVDMISLSPVQSASTSLSFTIKDTRFDQAAGIYLRAAGRKGQADCQQRELYCFCA